MNRTVRRGRAGRAVVHDPFEWLDIVETEGSFLSRPALKVAYPNGLDRPDAAVDDVDLTFRDAFDRWEKEWNRRAVGSDRDDDLGWRDEWVETVLYDLCGWGERLERQVPSDLVARSADGQVEVRPWVTLRVDGTDAAVVVLVDPVENLHASGEDGWSASAIDRTAALLRESGIPVGVTTDGRWWALVWAVAGINTGSGIFDAAIWREERALREAFFALAGLRSIAGGDPDRRLPKLFEASVASAETLTEALGKQVRSAVELLIQAFSESHVETLHRGAKSRLPENGHTVYEGAVTVMMRLVFLLFAEERGLLPPGGLYRDSYGMTTVVDDLRDRAQGADTRYGEESLEHSFETWYRLIATSRAVHGGVSYDEARMPAYGGSLFDPSRFPWIDRSDVPVRVNDRVMYRVLRAVQYATVGGDPRRVSFRDLDVEQIGYIYEGLLGYSARFTDVVIVGLRGRKNELGSEPEVTLDDLERLDEERGGDPSAFAQDLIEMVAKTQPGANSRTPRQIAAALSTRDDPDVRLDASRLLRHVVGDDKILIDRLTAFYPLIRHDLADLPYVVPAGGLVVVETQSRKTSGTHYTPRSLAEEVVQHALEPLVYKPGPLQTANRDQWRLISSAQILDLKVADIAAGSGAFLVAAARFLRDRLLEAWTREGIADEWRAGGRQGELETNAIREVIARCLYGADINEMAVEMCKLSLWLVSMDRDKPFSFVDDKIFHGNSLLGLTSVKQVEGLHIAPDRKRLDNPGFAVEIDAVLREAARLRDELATPVDEASPARSAHGKQAQVAQLGALTAQLRTISDGVIAAGLAIGGKPGRQLDAECDALSLALLQAFPPGGEGNREALDRIVEQGLTPTVKTDYERWKPLHWIIEVPDVLIDHGGFDALVGNPPFLGAKKISPSMGQNVRLWLVNQIANGAAGNADLVAYFFLRAHELLRAGHGELGLIATNSLAQGDTREVGLDQMVKGGLTIRRAIQSAEWPAHGAILEYAAVWGSTADVSDEARREVDGVAAGVISPLLEPEGRVGGMPTRLIANRRIAFQGSIVLGKGFILDSEQARTLIARVPKNAEVLFPYLNGDDLNSRPDSGPSRWVINFMERSKAEARRYVEPWAIVEREVMPERITKDAARYPRMVHEWWKYWNARQGLYAAIQQMDFVLVIARVSKTVMPVRVPTGPVFADATVVFATDQFEDEAVLSSALHQSWAIAYGGTMRADAAYRPRAVFETFPFPRRSNRLAVIGSILDNERREIMVRRHTGLTSLYNVVNSPHVNGNGDVDRMREIHVEVDEAVMEAYGWTDVSLDHGFHTYRQVERFTISPAARVEIFDRLLEENHRRAGAQAGGPDASVGRGLLGIDDELVDEGDS
jgi:hypothetical protein